MQLNISQAEKRKFFMRKIDIRRRIYIGWGEEKSNGGFLKEDDRELLLKNYKRIVFKKEIKRIYTTWKFQRPSYSGAKQKF